VLAAAAARQQLLRVVRECDLLAGLQTAGIPNSSNITAGGSKVRQLAILHLVVCCLTGRAAAAERNQLRRGGALIPAKPDAANQMNHK
jgi:hypothetical protein